MTGTMPQKLKNSSKRLQILKADLIDEVLTQAQK